MVIYPIVFRPEYDIRAGWLARLHPFDTCKWGKVARILTEWRPEKEIEFLHPDNPITDEELALVHTDQFIKDLKSRRQIVLTSEVCILYFIPLSWIDRVLMRPLRYQTSGTIMAAKLARDHKAVVNLGGGFHHCSARRSGGFCFFADITLAIKTMWSCDKKVHKPFILIVDCDAHQGNGYERDVLRMTKQDRKYIYIMDMFNANIYPKDLIARKAIDREIHLPTGTADGEYLRLLQFHLDAIINSDKFQANIIIYNAGTDILQGDNLGRLNISAEAIIQRDQIMFQYANKIKAHIIMLLSGGYQENNANIIADSIKNLIEQQLICSIQSIQS